MGAALPHPKVLKPNHTSSGCKGLAVGGHARLQGLSELKCRSQVSTVNVMG